MSVPSIADPAPTTPPFVTPLTAKPSRATLAKHQAAQRVVAVAALLRIQREMALGWEIWLEAKPKPQGQTARRRQVMMAMRQVLDARGQPLTHSVIADVLGIKKSLVSGTLWRRGGGE